MLVLPIFDGTIVRCTNCAPAHEKSKLGFVAFDLDFVEGDRDRRPHRGLRARHRPRRDRRQRGKGPQARKRQARNQGTDGYGAGRPVSIFDNTLSTALAFLANPCNLWVSERLDDRRAVLKFTFAERLRYKRCEGFRAANLSSPFKVLGDFHGR